MGNGSTIFQSESAMIEDVLKVMRPLYYNDDPLTQEDVKIAKECWSYVVSGKMEAMEELKKTSCFGYLEGVDIFKEIFLIRLFDVHPGARALFTSESIRSGKFIGSMIDMALRQLDDPKSFREKMVFLAHDHIQRGIRTEEYPRVGQVLLWTLQRVLGPSVFNRATEIVWQKIYSSMLKIIMPLSIHFEREEGRMGRTSIFGMQSRNSSQMSARSSGRRSRGGSKIHDSDKSKKAFGRNNPSSRERQLEVIAETEEPTGALTAENEDSMVRMLAHVNTTQTVIFEN